MEYFNRGVLQSWGNLPCVSHTVYLKKLCQMKELALFYQQKIKQPSYSLMNWVTSGVMKQTLFAKLAKVLYSKYLQKWM